jgi:hypothetical protein
MVIGCTKGCGQSKRSLRKYNDSVASRVGHAFLVLPFVWVKYQVHDSAHLELIGKNCAIAIVSVQAPRINTDGTIVTSRSPLYASAEQMQLTLLEGQCIGLRLVLENIGKMDIDHITVDVQSSSNVLAKYAHDCHPLVHFTGVHIIY